MGVMVAGATIGGLIGGPVGIAIGSKVSVAAIAGCATVGAALGAVTARYLFFLILDGIWLLVYKNFTMFMDLRFRAAGLKSLKTV